MRPPASFLIVSLRYIGDVLLSTPLARSIKAFFPDASVDYLVFGGTEAVLAGNPAVRKVLTVRPGSRDPRDLLGRWRSYDVAIGTNASDRTAFQLIAKGKHTVGFSESRPKEWWKRVLFTHCSGYDPGRHVVELLLGQLRHLGIPPVPKVSVHFGEGDLADARKAAGPGDFVLLHPYTRWEYKKWPAGEWAALSRRIEEVAGIRTLFSLAPGAAESRIREELRHAGIQEGQFVRGPLSLSCMAALLSMAKGYVGVDTVITHMAAALEKKTVAIFGPTPAWRWGPWPNGHSAGSPYRPGGGIQRRGDIVIVQKDWECASCDRMGCDHAPTSASRCLVELSAEEVYPEFSRLLHEKGA